MKIYLAGATGALGTRLLPMLIAAGHDVVGTTRSPSKMNVLLEAGATPVVVDALDAAAVLESVTSAKPDVIIHQLTALNTPMNPRKFDETFAATNLLRTRGTENLLAAGRAAGTKRLIAQSYTGWPNERSGAAVKTEEDPLDPAPEPEARQTLAAISALESMVADASDGPDVRASDHERDGVVGHLQAAFADGRLDDAEFDARMRTALTARTRAELEELLVDLPSDAPARAGTSLSLPPPGRLAVAYKNTVERGGRWRIPERYTAVIYKGDCRLDLRAAELTAPVTTIRAIAYKSNIAIIVPPAVRVEVGGVHVTKRSDDDWKHDLPPDAPVVHIRGFAYKGTVEALAKPAG